MPNIHTPLVSIVLPVYNRKHIIERAIRSVENQTVENWELLLIDDGSSDGLESIVLPIVEKRPRYRFLKHSHRGLSATRNIGIQAALGHYVTFLDSDDEYKPDHLELRVDFMKNHPDIDIIHGGIELVGPEHTHYVQDARDPSRTIHLSECCAGATFFGKKQAFQKSGGFKFLPYSAESEFLPRISAMFNVTKVDFPTYRYYTGLPDSICSLKQQISSD